MATRSKTAMPGVVLPEGSFLVRIGSSFFVGYNGNGKALAVIAPSRARHMRYEDADAECQRLISAGYKDACVTDCFGRFADLEVIADEARRTAERVKQFWSE